MQLHTSAQRGNPSHTSLNVGGARRGLAPALILMLWMASWAMPASAEGSPVVFVVDAALDQQAFDLSGEVLLEVSSRLADDTVFSVIVYDEVIQAVMPLAAMDKSRLNAIMQTLENANPTPTSNLAAGFERALDAFKDKQSGHIVFFSSATIDVQADEQRKQYLEWFEEILLPDSALKEFAITMVTNADRNSNRLLQMTSGYQHIEILPLAGNGDTSNNLLARLLKPAEQISARLTDQAYAGATDSSAGATVKPKDVAVAQLDNSQVTQAGTSGTSAGPSASKSNGDSTAPGSAVIPSWLQNKINFRFSAFVVAGAVLMLLAGLVGKTMRKRRVKDADSDQTDSTARSVYLTLDETPSGRLTSYDNDVDDAPEVSIVDEEARWTSKWTAHAGAAALPSTPANHLSAEQLAAEHLASEDTTHIAVSKPSPDNVITRKVAGTAETARNAATARTSPAASRSPDADADKDEDTTRRTIPAYLDDD